MLVGGGPQQEELNALRQTVRTNTLHILPWIQYDDLPELYGIASAFVLPSTVEPWGLVVNEAMAAALPVLVSRTAGCVPELVWRGINGYDFDPRDIWGLAGLLEKVASGRCDLKAMGRASQRLILNFTPESWAAVLGECVRQTLEQRNESRHCNGLFG